MIMFPRKKENEKPKTEDGGQKTEPKPASAISPVLPDEATKLQKQIEDLRKEKDDIFAKLQRVAADYDNYQKRSAKQITDSVAYEKDKIIKVLLPVLDDFERAIMHAENVDSVVEGVKLVYEHLKGVLRSQGVEQIETAGQHFDPSVHEAIAQQSDESKEDGMILEELQKGYKLNGRVIRASRVVVNKAPSAQAEQKATEEDETRDTQ
jgi:molecular chaperone GrpE